VRRELAPGAQKIGARARARARCSPPGDGAHDVPEGLVDIDRPGAAAVGDLLDHRQQLAGLLHEALVLQLRLIVALHGWRSLLPAGRTAAGRRGCC
jgi:hypothetical protein